MIISFPKSMPGVAFGGQNEVGFLSSISFSPHKLEAREGRQRERAWALPVASGQRPCQKLNVLLRFTGDALWAPGPQ